MALRDAITGQSGKVQEGHQERLAAISGVLIFRIVDGKVQEAHCIFDQMGLMQQIGAFPTPEHATT
jgi:hypothetical protein